MATGINKSEVMRKAWAIYRDARTECERRGLAKGFLANRRRWSNALKAAWSIVKAAVRSAALDAATRAAENNAVQRARLLDLEMSEPSHRGPLHFLAIAAARAEFRATC